MKPGVMAFVVSVAAVALLVGSARAEGPAATEGASAPAAPQADNGPSVATPEEAPTTPAPSEARKLSPAVHVPPPAVILLRPRLSDVQAVRARQLLPVQRGSGVAASDGAPVVAADGLGLELQRTYAGDGGAR